MADRLDHERCREGGLDGIGSTGDGVRNRLPEHPDLGLASIASMGRFIAGRERSQIVTNALSDRCSQCRFASGGPISHLYRSYIVPISEDSDRIGVRSGCHRSAPNGNRNLPDQTTGGSRGCRRPHSTRWQWALRGRGLTLPGDVEGDGRRTLARLKLDFLHPERAFHMRQAGGGG